MSTTGAGTSLRGISTRINGRHAFVHERVLELIARETKASGSVDFSKAELADRMGCCVRSLDRALTRLRREGLVVSTPVFNKVGGQLGNRYTATPEGIERAQRLARRRSPWGLRRLAVCGGGDWRCRSGLAGLELPKVRMSLESGWGLTGG